MSIQDMSARLDAFAELAYKAKSAEVAASQNIPYPIDVEGPRERLQDAKAALLRSFSAMVRTVTRLEDELRELKGSP